MALKIDIIKGAYSQLAISGVTVGASNEDLKTALERLEDMAAEFQSRNICTEYNFQDKLNLNDESNIKREFFHAFKTNLAVRLIPDFIRDVPGTLIKQANQSLSNMSARTAKVRQVDYPTRMPTGSANTFRGNLLRYNRPSNKPPQSCSTNYMHLGDINDFVEHFDSYLDNLEDIDSFIIESSSGINVITSTNSFTDVTYRVKATGSSGVRNDLNLEVKITITTTEGRVESRRVIFSIV